jgi:hypothetical protein
VSDAIAFPPPIPLPTATRDDDLVMDRLATWLAEVSAEATMRPSVVDAEPPTAETMP